MDESTHLIDFVRILYKWRKPAAVFFCAVVLGALAYCVVTPNQYTARATLIPGTMPSDVGSLTSMAGSFASRLGLINILGGSLPANSADVASNTLRSRFIARNVVNKLGLVKVYKIRQKDPYRAGEKATNLLLKRSAVDVSDMLLVSVDVTDRDPKRAADIANAFVDELDKANQQFSLTSAGKGREFVEKRLTETEKALIDAQQALIKFEQQHGTVSLDEQSRATVEVAARLEGQIIALQAKRDALSAMYTPSYSKLRELDLNIAALRAKVRSLTAGGETGGVGAQAAEGGRGVTSQGGVFIPLGKVPTLAAEYARLLLGVNTQGQVLELLVQQHEQLKIEEAKNVPTIQVLDRAFPPIKKSKPARTLIMLVAGLLGMVGSFALVLLLNYFGPEFDAQRSAEMKGMARNVLAELRSRLPGRSRARTGA